MEHEQLKQSLIEEGKQQGLNAGDLKVLSTDPFFVGSQKDYEDAKWIAALWDRMMSQRKKSLHLRGFHYWVMSSRVKKPNGKFYTEPDPAKDWTYLLHCAQVARYLGIGEWKNLVDLKHPNPIDYDKYWTGSGIEQTGEVDVQAQLNSKLDGLVEEFLRELLWNSPKYHTDGYQLFHLEVWVEKSSMGFIIEPQCKKYEACYQPLVGQASVEKVNMSADRAIKAAMAGKRVRIFYIADYDRYGWSMVSAVARKLEFFSKPHGPGADIKLARLALSENQIKKFNLPKAPKHGEEVVELDALEAIYPGELGKIVEDALKPYYDSEKPRIVESENRRIREKVKNLLEVNLKKPLEDAFLGLSLEGIVKGFTLTEAMNKNFSPPHPDHEVKEQDNWIYDSGRDYFEQLTEYKKYKSSRSEENTGGD